MGFAWFRGSTSSLKAALLCTFIVHVPKSQQQEGILCRRVEGRSRGGYVVRVKIIPLSALIFKAILHQAAWSNCDGPYFRQCRSSEFRIFRSIAGISSVSIVLPAASIKGNIFASFNNAITILSSAQGLWD